MDNTALVIGVLAIALILFADVLLRHANLGKYINETSLDEEEFLTEYEIERLKRIQQFDSRIKSIDDELELRKSGFPADELHPSVRNIPHAVVRVNDLPDVEVSE